MREGTMKDRINLLVVASCISLFIIASCSDKNSSEACRFQTTLNLDKGNYDAVLGSSCADQMQKGAAWFGKAGYDIKNVLNRFIDANKNNSGSTQSDLEIYMTALIGPVKSWTLTYLDNAMTSYSSVPASSEYYKDALFYTSLVDIMKSLSLIKIVIPDLEINGQLNMTCDKNGNGVPDTADATACALTVAQSISTGSTTTCSYTRSTPVDITLYQDQTLLNPITGTYSGLVISITGTGTPACTTTQYSRLLYKNPANPAQYWGATTTSELCYGSDGNKWYCPVTGSNLDLVTALDTSIYGAMTTLASSITTTGSDLQTSINQVHTDACKTPCPTPCTPPACPGSCVSGATTYCSSPDISNYITTYLK
jgi:hypothetical protein